MRAILTYHSIDPSGSVISVDEATLRRHAEWLAAAPPRAVTMEELLTDPDGEDRIAVVFDDAFENFGSAAWPILRDLGIPATVFVVTGRAGGRNDWGGVREPGIPTLPLLDWDALGRLAEEGVHVGSHTREHPRLAGLEPDRLAEEVAGSAEDLEARLGRRPAGFAYPYGSVDAAAESTVEKAYAWACTTELSTLEGGEPAHLLPRLDAYYLRRPGQLEAWGTGTFRARLSLRRAARAARFWLTKGRAEARRRVG